LLLNQLTNPVESKLEHFIPSRDLQTLLNHFPCVVKLPHPPVRVGLSQVRPRVCRFDRQGVIGVRQRPFCIAVVEDEADFASLGVNDMRVRTKP
jgi:hypothetical protein